MTGAHPPESNLGLPPVRFERLELAEPPHPGRILAAELSTRQQSQSDFAARAGLSAKHVNQILKGTASLSADSAISVERVLGIPASFWLGVDARWQEHRSRQRQRSELEKLTHWVERFPMRELTRRGYISEGATAADAVSEVLAAFRVADPEAFERVWLTPMSSGFRRAQQFPADQFSTATWLLLAERQTEAHELPGFSVTELRRLVHSLRPLTRYPVVEGFLEARRLLATCGVGLTFVEQLRESRITGATWWPTLNRPIIALCERHQRVDVFWFALFHEIAHLLLHPRRRVFLEFTGNDDTDGLESEASAFAAEELIPATYNSAITAAPIAELPVFANSLDVGIAVVAGRRARLTDQWAAVNKMREALDVAGLVDADQRPL